METAQQTIQTTLDQLLKHMGISAQISVRQTDDVLVFNIQSEDSAILIGQHGVNLNALQYLTRVLVHKQLGAAPSFVIDIGDYKKSREEYLRELARQAASRVRETRESLLLKPMTPYERRVVHSELGNLEDVATESRGEDPERRILIKPVG